MSGAITQILPADYREMPWRNGGGSTTEIAIEPAGAALGSAVPFVWRLSMARIEGDGPFSRFVGYDRTLVLLDGGGMVLHFGAAAPPVTLAAPLASVAFAGEWETRCQLLGGPVRDFNVMVDRQRAVAQVQILALPAHGTATPEVCGHTTLLYVQKGRVTLRLGGPANAQAVATAAAGDTLRFASATPGEPGSIVAEDAPAQVILVDLALL